MKKNEKKKPIFEKVGLVFRSPIRADIMKEISYEPKRPIDIADNIGVQKQKLNYHLNELKKGGLVKTHQEVRNEEELPSDRGIRINGATKNGKIKYSHGVELTTNGKDIVTNFLNQLYEKEPVNNEESKNIRKKNKKKINNTEEK
jgi:DNA-binding transcriptional ArsR family regulator